MGRLHTCSRRRRRQRDRTLGDAVLQSWECYVDTIDRRTVDLVIREGGDRNDETIGIFPRHLFWHVPDLRRGMFLTVEVLKSRRILIRPIPVDPDAPNVGLEFLRAMERSMRQMMAEWDDEPDERRERELLD